VTPLDKILKEFIESDETRIEFEYDDSSMRAAYTLAFLAKIQQEELPLEIKRKGDKSLVMTKKEKK
jgi:hypothetical protein